MVLVSEFPFDRHDIAAEVYFNNCKVSRSLECLPGHSNLS